MICVLVFRRCIVGEFMRDGWCGEAINR